MRARRHWLSPGKVGTLMVLGAVTGVTAFAPSLARAYDCTSMDPKQWPPPAKPYYMIAFDTSGSMGEVIAACSNNANRACTTDAGCVAPGTCVVTANSCGYATGRYCSNNFARACTTNANCVAPGTCGLRPTKVDHGRCAVSNTVKAFSGEVNFGLATFPVSRTCGNPCYTACGATSVPTGFTAAGCDNQQTGVNERGAVIRVPMWKDRPSEPSNIASILTWVNNDCSDGQELIANGNTPLSGILRDMYRYFSNQWTAPGYPTYLSPLESAALGEMSCRSVNTILVTDGGETCGGTATCNGIACYQDAARTLYNGFTKNAITWHVKTFVIDFATGSGNSDAIADYGDDGLHNTSTTAYPAANEAQLSQALATIISTAIRPEVCDNVDNNSGPFQSRPVDRRPGGAAGRPRSAAGGRRLRWGLSIRFLGATDRPSGGR